MYVIEHSVELYTCSIYITQQQEHFGMTNYYNGP